MKKILAFMLSLLIFAVIATDAFAAESVISGYYDDYAKNSDYFYFAINDNISCYDENFQNVWSNSFGGSSFDRFVSVAATDRMVVGAGYAKSTDGDFEGMDIPEMIEPLGSEWENAYVVAFDPQSGDVLWSNVFGGGRRDKFLYVEILEETQEIYVVGTTTSGDCLLNPNEEDDIYSYDERTFYLIYDFDGNIIEKAQLPSYFSENLPNMNIRLVVKRTDLTKSYDEVFENDLSDEEYFEQFVSYCVDEYNHARIIDKKIIYSVFKCNNYYFVAGDRLFRNEYVSDENGEREYSLLTETSFDDIYSSGNEYNFNKLFLTGIAYISELDNGNFAVIGTTINSESSEFAPKGECAVMCITDSDLNIVNTKYQNITDEYTRLFCLGTNIYFGNHNSVYKNFQYIPPVFPQNEEEVKEYYESEVEDEFFGDNLAFTLFMTISSVFLVFLLLFLIFEIYEKFFGAKAIKQRKIRKEMYLSSNWESAKSIFIEYDYKKLNTFIPFAVFSIVASFLIHLREILYNIIRFGQYPGLKIFLSQIFKIYITFFIIIVILNILKFVVSKISTRKNQYKISKAVITKQEVVENYRKATFKIPNIIASFLIAAVLSFVTAIIVTVIQDALYADPNPILVVLVSFFVYFIFILLIKPTRKHVKKKSLKGARR